MNISDIKFSLGNLRLPIYGLRFPNWHVLVTTPNIKDLFMRHSMFDRASVGVGNTAATKSGFDTLNSFLNNDQTQSTNSLVAGAIDALPSPLEAVIGFYGSLSPLLRLATITFPRMHWLRSYMFLGVQPQRFKGFTCLTDAKYDSGEESFMRYILSPDEYIIHHTPVHSCTEGTVVEIRDGVQDNVREDNTLKFGSSDVEEHLGNMIRINHGVCQLTYGGLMRNSITVKKGDKVEKGDVIAKVGASAYSKIPFLYLGISYIGPKLPIAGNLGLAFRNESIFWEEHFQCPLLNQLRNGLKEYNSRGDVFAKIDPQHIRYTMPDAKRIPDLALVRRYPPGIPLE